MGNCCSIEKEANCPDLRKDNKISEFDADDAKGDLIRDMVVSNKEKIEFEVKDNPLVEYSKDILRLLNKIRTSKEEALQFIKKYNLKERIKEDILLNKRPDRNMIWSDKKSRFISDYFAHQKNIWKSRRQKMNEIKTKYEENYNVFIYDTRSEKNNPELCLVSLFMRLEEKDLNIIFNEDFEICIIFSEYVCNYTFADAISQKDIHTEFFFFQNISNNESEILKASTKSKTK